MKRILMSTLVASTLLGSTALAFAADTNTTSGQSMMLSDTMHKDAPAYDPMHTEDKHNGLKSSVAPMPFHNVGGPLIRSLRDRPVVAMIYDKSSSACQRVNPILEPLVKSGETKVHVVIFDVTSAQSAAVAEARAKQIGLESFFQAKKTALSTVAVINPRNGELVGQFFDDTEKADYADAIAQTKAQLAKRR